jgi:deoxycytidine triphosphate deaminase
MVLSDRSIKEALKSGRILIEPIGDDCIQPSSVDLHIDQYFRVFRNHSQRIIDVREAQEDLTELIDVGTDTPMILHPGEFMLGSTTERIAIPDDIVARLDGKSSLGRLGLVIHSTAGFVDAGWDGHITLVPGHEDRSNQFFRNDYAGRPALRIVGVGFEVPRAAWPDPQPLLGQLQKAVTTIRRSGGQQC